MVHFLDHVYIRSIGLRSAAQHVGVVVTDSGSPNVTVNLSATSACTDLGELSSTIIFGDGSIGGETAEDRFVGFVSATGISSIGVGTAMEIDHLQFGW